MSGGGDTPADPHPEVDRDAQTYIDQIAAEHRPLFDRLHRLIVTTHPDVSIGMSYKMPVYALGNRRLYVGVWRHGLSVYGWPQRSEAVFTSRHPALRASKGTIRLSPQDAHVVTDDDLLLLVEAGLGS